jgi:Anti-sigma regulatory factor (Ser/Thr protein kinase)
MTADKTIAGSELGEKVFTADPAQLSGIRQWVQGVAESTPLQNYQVEDLLTAVDEAASNAIRHATPGERDRHIWVRCAVLEDGLQVRVRDEGRGFLVPDVPKMPGPEATGGRGLPLMCALADSVEIASGAQGTTVTLSKRVQPPV